MIKDASAPGGYRRESAMEFLRRRSIRSIIWIAFLTVLVAAGSLFLLFPVAFMLSTSLKTQGGAFLVPMKWIPGLEFVPQWKNYPAALNFMKWSITYANTIKVAVAVIAGEILSATVVAYGFARFRAPGKNFLFAVVLSSMMLPAAVRLVPEYLGFSRLGMVDTFWPLILPSFFGGGAFNIFLMRQFFTTIPIQMDEAAKIDGAGPFAILFQVLLPQIKPVLFVVAINGLTFTWNDFMRPLIYLNDPNSRTAALALSFFQGNYGGTPFHLLMAASVVMMTPLVLLFFFFQRTFVQGIVITGVKG